MHVPAGAVPKDGPSAGVALFGALASLLLGRKARSDVAVTDEISLRDVLLPARNREDFEEVPAGARKHLRPVWLETVDDALAAALEPAKRRGRQRSRTSTSGP